MSQVTNKIIHIGQVLILSTFTQLYENRIPQADFLLSKRNVKIQQINQEMMLEIISVENLLHDIYHREATTNLMRWIHKK